MNVKMAVKAAKHEGIQVKTVIANDDVASAPKDQSEKRRGVAGEILMWKCAGAKAALGGNLDEVIQAADKAIRHTHSIGIGLTPCTLPGSAHPNFIIQEYPGLDSGWDRGVGYLKTPFEVVDGYIAVPKGPGLGIEVNEEMLTQRAYPGDWDTPHMRHIDGSVADW